MSNLCDDKKLLRFRAAVHRLCPNNQFLLNQPSETLALPVWRRRANPLQKRQPRRMAVCSALVWCIIVSIPSYRFAAFIEVNATSTQSRSDRHRRAFGNRYVTVTIRVISVAKPWPCSRRSNVLRYRALNLLEYLPHIAPESCRRDRDRLPPAKGSAVAGSLFPKINFSGLGTSSTNERSPSKEPQPRDTLAHRTAKSLWPDIVNSSRSAAESETNFLLTRARSARRCIIRSRTAVLWQRSSLLFAVSAIRALSGALSLLLTSRHVGNVHASRAHERALEWRIERHMLLQDASIISVERAVPLGPRNSPGLGEVAPLATIAPS